MATYLIKRELTITRQEGDTADVVIVAPDVLDMDLYDVQFKVVDSSRRPVMNKTTAGGTITKDGQTITIPLLTADTKNKAGKHSWEMQITTETEVITIGRGPFIIISETIR